MKKFFRALLLAGISFATCAAQPLALVFESADGSRISFVAKSLVLTPGDGVLNVSNGETEAEIELPSLAKMYFTGESASVDFASVDLERDGVEVYDMSGRHVGAFESAASAVASLPGGLYVIKTECATIKIRVK